MQNQIATSGISALDIYPYTRCNNCGNYIETPLKNKTLYCSAACSEEYSLCEICGKYYPKKTGHGDSLKCLIKFDINRKGNPCIRQTMLKVFLTGTPLLNTALMAERLALVLKLPLFMTEQFRIESSLDISTIREVVGARLKSENLPEYFIFLGNTHNLDFLRELSSGYSFDKILILERSTGSAHESIHDNPETGSSSEAKNTICTKCGNINSFSMPDYEGNSECLVCGNQYFRTSEGRTSIIQKLNNYVDCEKYLLEAYPRICTRIEAGDTPGTVNNIVKLLVYG